MASDLSNTETRTVEGFGAIAPTDHELNQQSSALMVTLTPYLIRARSR